jgi:RNA polymerase-binding transcription factor DksA
MDQELIALNKRRLEEEKLRLEELLSRFAHREDEAGRENFRTDFPNVGDSTDENALEVAMYETRLGEEKALEEKLSKVNAALARIDAGIYGKCVVGGEEIEEARLRVAPEADTCVIHSS